MDDPSLSLTGKRILIVEDEPIVAMEHTAVLSEAGAEIVATCASVTRAIQCLNNTEVDVAVVDYLLADRNSEPSASSTQGATHSVCGRQFLSASAHKNSRSSGHPP
jgi:DNA-binding NarL/FixJ family response regulator